MEEISKICERLSLSDEDGPVARMGVGLQENGIRLVSLSLIGKIIANREINREAFRSIIPRIWKTKHEFSIELIGTNTFVFQFKCHWDRKRVLEGGPWCFDKHLIVLREAKGLGKVSEVDFSLTPLWIHMHNLPLACMSKEAGIFLGNFVGSVVEVDAGSSGSYMGKYLRVRVEVDVTKALRRGIRVLMGDPEEKVVVVLRYERLPNFCYFCGIIGHLVRDCTCNTKGVEEAQYRFGVWMRANTFTPSDKGSRSFGGDAGRHVNSDEGSDGSRGPRGETQSKNVEREGGVEKGGISACEIDVGSTEKSEKVFDSIVAKGRVELKRNICPGVDTSDDRSSVGKVKETDSFEFISGGGASSFSSEGELSSIQHLEASEVCSPKQKKWKRLARAKGKMSMGGRLGILGKREAEIDERALFPCATVSHVDFWGSDHSLVLISGVCKSASNDYGNKNWFSRFFFEEAWIGEADCKPLVASAWLAGVGVDAISSVKNSVASVAFNLKKWNREKKRRSDLELSSLREELSAPSISHLFFADDSLIFVRASQSECRSLKDILELYERASGGRCLELLKIKCGKNFKGGSIGCSRWEVEKSSLRQWLKRFPLIR
ncbi:hypothetical protein ACOSQ3_018434 [Xanthoceras sorbifolium]